MKKPKVTIIVPVYNAEKYVRKLMDSLIELDYPKNKLQILIIDNKSDDDTKKIIGEYPVTILEENSLQSSYAARNKGIEHAQGNILVFTDADCEVDSQWIVEGIKKIVSGKGDIIGGQVKFTNQNNPAQLYDAAINLNNKRYIEKLNSAVTANLFVNKKIFSKIGKFDNKLRSGGDFKFSNDAYNKGYTLTYAKESIVYHSPRSFSQLIKKSIRVGKGAPIIWKDKESFPSIIKIALLNLLPRRLKKIKNDITEEYYIRFEKYKYKMFIIDWICRVFFSIGMLISLPNYFKKK